MKALNKQIAAIHADAKRAGMDEDTRRAFMKRVCGCESCAQMSREQAKKVILALRRLPGLDKPAPRSRAVTVSGKYAGLLRALWLDAYHLGAVHNRDDKALIAFAKRQTGLEHTQFLTDGALAAKVVEGLKSIMTREAGVDWAVDARPGRERVQAWQRRVLAAQRRKLGIYEAPKIAANELNDEIARLGQMVRAKRKGLKNAA